MAAELLPSTALAAADGAAPPPLEEQQQHAMLAAPTPPKSAGDRRVGLVFDRVMELHMREGHPEHPARVQVLNARLEEAGLLARCRKLQPKLATDEELLACHSRQHIDRVEGLYTMAPHMVTSEGAALEHTGDTWIITGDIYCNASTKLAARSAAGCAVQAVHAVLDGQVDSAFAVVRPPGHHAESSQLQGFCFYNNASVAAAAALAAGVQRVLIFDWDVHAGNGTQEIWFGDDRVLFVSLHRRDKDFYPVGVGYETEVGQGRGEGFNVNVPWSSKGVGNADFMAALSLLLDPIIASFDPQLVIVSAGFDAAEGDFLGKCCVTPAGFAAMTSALLRYAGGKVVAVLEGGYVPGIVADCAAAMLQRLLGEPALPLPPAGKVHKCTGGVLARVDAVMRPYWTSLAALPEFESRFKACKAALALEALSLASSGSLQTGMVTRRHKAAAASTPGGSCGAGSSGVAAAAAAPDHTGSLAARAPPLSRRRPAAAPAAAASPGPAAPAATAAPAAVPAATAVPPAVLAAAPAVPAAAPAAAPVARRIVKIKMPPSAAAKAAAAAALGAGAAPAASSTAAQSASSSSGQQQQQPATSMLPAAAPAPSAAAAALSPSSPQPAAAAAASPTPTACHAPSGWGTSQQQESGFSPRGHRAALRAAAGPSPVRPLAPQAACSAVSASAAAAAGATGAVHRTPPAAAPPFTGSLAAAAFAPASASVAAGPGVAPQQGMQRNSAAAGGTGSEEYADARSNAFELSGMLSALSVSRQPATPPAAQVRHPLASAAPAAADVLAAAAIELPASPGGAGAGGALEDAFMSASEDGEA